ncbi:MAG: hydroxyacid dehydrogenase [Bacteroidetes bacterium]|nr:hydroxyacid dehydrogenase [Bacteroidota bacterium]MBL6944881.1 hydroxyacid dehydrogenase [Bacteroidales bacterium]
MGKRKILFIDTTHQALVDRLELQGFECDYFADYRRQELLQIADKYTGIIIRSKIKLDADFLMRCSHLKFIGRVGAGMENIDTDFAKKQGIVCLNAPEGNRNAVGEHAVGMILTLFNKLITADNQVRKGKWIREGNRGYELGGLTVGIIGYGNTGGSFAKKLKGFDVEVIAYDKYKQNYSDEFVKELEMVDLFERSDIVSVHIPFNFETEYLVDAKFINKFRKNIYVVNTSRGKILRTSDLIKCLKSGKVLGACLDVLEYEELSFENMKLHDDFQALITMENVVLSPHIAGWTHESNYKMASVIADKIEALDL